MTKKVVILGSTGSIGESTLEVVESLKGAIKVVGLSANTNTERLALQVERLKPIAAAISGDVLADDLSRTCLRAGTELFRGVEGLLRVATMPEADLVVNGLVGAAGIAPTLEAIRAGKDVAIANKESLVAAGSIILKEAEAAGVTLIPIDSEHSAIYQCMRGEERRGIRRIILTASGGPLIDKSRDEIERVTAEEALSHPNWTMGKKVTIDSATLLNKGFEVIEACWLFGVGPERVDVVVERKSLVHSLVEFVDGSVSALLSAPDMRLPIQYALTFPERAEAGFARLDLEAMGTIAFERPDRERFPCLELAYRALALGGTAPAVLSAADEIAVAAFLAGRLRFGDIFRTLNEVLSLHEPERLASIDTVLRADRWARLKTAEMIEARESREPKC